MDADWQSNLQNWKQSRKSQSSYQRVQDLEAEEEIPRKAKSKTYKEMIEERQRRKSSHEVHSHIDYEDENFEYELSKARAASNDDLSKPSGAEIQEHRSISALTSTPKTYSSEEKNFKAETNSFVKTSEELGKENPSLTDRESISSDLKSQRVNTLWLHDVTDHKVDAKLDSNVLRDGKKSANFSVNREKFETGNANSPPAKSLNEVKNRTGGGTNVADKLKMWNKPTDAAMPNAVDQKKISHIGNGKGNIGTVKSNSSNMFSEKIIRINQRPNHEKGFGFTITGGREFNAPIVVDKVVRGGSADICELKAGDEIIAINGADVGRHYNNSVHSVLEQAVATGTIELKIKRLKDLADDFEEEVFSDDEMKHAPNKRTSQFSDSMSSQWSSPPSSPPAMPSVADTSDDLLPPPPLPSVPPPPPNWNTFPGEVVPHASNSNTSFILPENPFNSNLGNKSDSSESQSLEIPDVSKEDILRRKSQFFGLKLEESQEFKALQEEKEKKLKQAISVDLTPLPASLPSLPRDHHDDKTFPITTKSHGSYLEEEREKEKLREKEEELRRKEEMMRKEEERLQREKERMERETKEHLTFERERLQREKELQQERERLLKEKEEQLHQELEMMRREMKEDTQRQNEKQLRMEIERLEREKEQQLMLERERLKREKEEEIQREKERLQRERERLQKEQAERLRVEQEKLKAEREMPVRNFPDTKPLIRGFTSDHEPSARKPSVEPSEAEVAEYSMRYGGKTFARLAAQTRSESLGEFSVPKSAPKAPASNFLKTEPNFEKSVGRKINSSDKSGNFSSIRSNFEHGKSSNTVNSSKELDSWDRLNQRQPRTHDQFEGAVHSDQHRPNAGLPLDAKIKNPPQVSLRTTSLAPSYGDSNNVKRQPMERQSAVVGFQITDHPLTHKSGPQTTSQTTSFRKSSSPEITERTTSLQPHFGEQNERENVAVHDRYNQKPFEQITSTRPQNKEPMVSYEQLLREEKFSYKAQHDHAGNPQPGNQSSYSNVSYLLYGDTDETAGKSADGIGSGGYNSHSFNHNIPTSPRLPSFSESRYPQPNGQLDKSHPRQSENFPSNSSRSMNQFNDSWPSTKTSVPSNSKNIDINEANQRKARTLGPRPFESSWKQSGGIGDHWLIEEAERSRIAEATGEQRAWSLGQETKHLRHVSPSGYPSNSHQTLPNRVYLDDNTMHSKAHSSGVPFDSVSLKSPRTEFHPPKSPRSIPEPVKQTLLSRINTGSSAKPLSPPSPLPSYPLSRSLAPSHSRSVSNPVTDLNPFAGSGRPFAVASHSAASPSYPSYDAAVDSLFAYHQSNPSGTNLVSQQSLSRSHGSLHLDGTPQYADMRTQRIQGPYPGPYDARDADQRSNSYTVFVRDRGHVADSFPQHCQPIVQNLLCSVCQRPLKEIGGNVSMRDGDLRLRCQNCFHENEVKYSKV